MERAKILIVDDDPDLRRAMKIRLRANHYDTVLQLAPRRTIRVWLKDSDRYP